MAALTQPGGIYWRAAIAKKVVLSVVPKFGIETDISFARQAGLRVAARFRPVGVGQSPAEAKISVAPRFIAMPEGRGSATLRIAPRVKSTATIGFTRTAKVSVAPRFSPLAAERYSRPASMRISPRFTALGTAVVPTFEITGINISPGNSVALPDHIPGKLIVLYAYCTDTTGAAPAKPIAGGFVPDWEVHESAVDGNINSAGTLASFVATAANHMSGNWGNATKVLAMVIQAQKPGDCIGDTAIKADINFGTAIDAPALVLQKPDGTGLAIHILAGGDGVNTINFAASAPTGYSRKAVSNGSATQGSLAVSTKNVTTSAPLVSEPLPASWYTSVSLEVLAPVPTYGGLNVPVIVYQPTIQFAPIAPTINATAEVYLPAVIYPVDLPAAISATVTAHNPSLLYPVIEPTPIDSTVDIQTPLIQYGVFPDFASCTIEAYDPTILQILTLPAQLSSTINTYDPIVIAPIMEPPLVSSTVTVEQPVVHYNITPDPIDATVTVFEPTILAKIEAPAAITSTVNVFTPTVLATIEAPAAISATVTVHTPTVSTSTGAAYDSVGAGNVSPGTSQTSSITLTQTNCDVFVAVVTFSISAAPDSVTVGGQAATLVGSAISWGQGYTRIYRKAQYSGSGPTSIVVSYASAGYTNFSSCAIAASGVSSVGSIQSNTASGSQNITCSAGQLIIWSYSGYSDVSSSSGGTLRYDSSGATLSHLLLRTATVSTTFSGNVYDGWEACVGFVLS
jgi:hypothetical protein